MLRETIPAEVGSVPEWATRASDGINGSAPEEVQARVMARAGM